MNDQRSSTCRPDARIAIVISSLAQGGAERVASIMANHWAVRGMAVTVITTGGTEADSYELDGRIQRVALNQAGTSRTVLHGLSQNVRRILALRAAIRSVAPRAIISFIERTNVVTLFATRGLGVPVVISERTDPRMYEIGPMWEAWRKLTYRWSDALVLQTEGALSWADKAVHARRALAIPNPVPRQCDRVGHVDLRIRGPVMVAMGRLVWEKGFDLLLQAASIVLSKHADWSLVILGEGPEREGLERLVVELGLRGRVRLPGRHPQPDEVLRQADLFVLSSRYEGFPNALCEAMASGLAVVSFACPSGPDEIIRDGVDGVLVPPDDVAALARAMDALMSDPERRDSIGRRATEITERYSEERIMGMWDRLIDEVSGRECNA